MINNRQGGRRRGRGGGGGPRPNNVPSGGGNRQDNRQRGNAAQLLEKYRQLARDSQLGGDRIQTEYYLQFAEHYFRLLNENRARFEEQRPRHRDDEYADEDEGEEELVAEGDGDERGQEEDFRRDRPRRDYRDQREARGPRDGREVREPREPRPVEAEADGRNGEVRNGEAAGRRRRRPLRDQNGEDRMDEGGEARIALDSLPPAIGADLAPVGDGEGADETPRPRRRTRRPRAEEDDITPAAA